MNLGDLPATLFSPAKMIYIGYVLLAGLKRIETTLAAFLVFSAIFFVVEVLHNDFLRIVLNRKASIPRTGRGMR
ncbi:MAG: hypothetical protein GY769_06885 [bacterium]|nr:hypothetical protein [bacterium]